jgi:hypothetical protein
MSMTSARTIRYQARQQKKEQQLELERDRFENINRELHKEMQCTAGLCEYCDDKADVCIHCSTIDDYFVHVCRAHEWECCLNIADRGEFDDDELMENKLVYLFITSMTLKRCHVHLSKTAH